MMLKIWNSDRTDDGTYIWNSYRRKTTCITTYILQVDGLRMPQRVSQCCCKSLGFIMVAFSLLHASGLARLAQGGGREAEAHVHPGRSSTTSWCGWVEIDGCGGGGRR